MSQMLKSSGAMAAATLTSRVLGMVREMVYAAFMSDGWVASAFQMAFNVPNLFRRLLGEGALTAAFIPLFKEKEKKEGEAEMWRAANAVISGLVLVSIAVVVLGILIVSGILLIGQHDSKTTLMFQLLRLMFPYVLLVCLTAIFMGMLNARGHFFIPALGAATLNVVMIASVIFLTPLFGVEVHQKVFALAVGVVLAGIVQAAFQMPTLYGDGFRFHWVSPWKNEMVRRVVQRMLPSTVGVAAFQINVLLTQALAFCLGDNIVASFGYAVRLMELPQGVFGISLSTYLLPTLSGLATEKKFKEFRQTLNQGIDHLVFINLLASVLLFTLAEPMIRLLFEHKNFGPDATDRATFALTCLAPGLLAFSMVNILARAFYALGDTKTPMKISVFCLAVNLLLALTLVWRFKQGGLGMANTVSSITNMCLLFYALRRKLGRLDSGGLREMLAPIFGAGLIAAAVAWCGRLAWEHAIGHEGLWRRLGEVFVPMTAASVIYLGLALWFKVPPALEIGGLVLKKLRKQG